MQMNRNWWTRKGRRSVWNHRALAQRLLSVDLKTRTLWFETFCVYAGEILSWTKSWEHRLAELSFCLVANQVEPRTHKTEVVTLKEELIRNLQARGSNRKSLCSLFLMMMNMGKFSVAQIIMITCWNSTQPVKTGQWNEQRFNQSGIISICSCFKKTNQLRSEFSGKVILKSATVAKGSQITTRPFIQPDSPCRTKGHVLFNCCWRSFSPWRWCFPHQILVSGG